MNISNLILHDQIKIGHKFFKSRLMLGTGKYRNFQEATQSIVNSRCEIVTVAIRRAKNAKLNGKINLIDALDWNKLWLLPNTAGCETVEEAIRIAILGRELAKHLGQEDNNFIKLEIIPDPKYLLPDPIGTLKAAEYLIKKGFAVLPYINPDPVLAKQLEELGCVTLMPLGSPIGSGQGLKNLYNINIIIESTKVPVIIDAGIGTASDASRAMELGADAVLLNSSVAKSLNPPDMALSMKLAVESGRIAYLAGRMPLSNLSQSSSTIQGLLN
uniref:Thiazole synthase n=1 Tax=Compsopogon caeruleus TaxID=31354 RepID=A0A1Z1XBC6_9RHOD|nr:thiamin biosynthesis protein G [Compsopogon caeruleus]ARX96173.1 thiamin biosynthesis protein G [Compsopogon caeruleus]